MSLDDLDLSLGFQLDRVGRDGMGVDLEQLDEFLNLVERQMRFLRSECQVFGVENPNSTQQVKLYFGGLGIQTKTVAKAFLQSNLDIPGVEEILMYRSISKQFSFLNSLSEFLGFDNRVTYKFKIDHGTTGRIYVTDFNLQQLPPLGRDCIYPDGKSFVVFDYNQFDLRMIAADSGDEVLCEAFLNGQDPYEVTARGSGLPYPPEAPRQIVLGPQLNRRHERLLPPQ